MFGRYSELCARSSGGVCWQPDGGGAEECTCEARGETFPTHCWAKCEAINYQQTEAEDELFHTGGREMAKTLYFIPKVG